MASTSWHKLKHYLGFVTVEPVAFLMSLSAQMHSIVFQTAMYGIYCHQLLNKINTTVDCDHLSDDTDVENEVQRYATHWSMINSLARLLPSLFTYVILGAWGDIHGRKINILIGLASSLVSAVPLIFLIEYPDTPLWIYVTVEFFTGFVGTGGLVMMSSFAYLADVVRNKDTLTVRMVIYTLVSSISGIIGSSMASGLMQILPPSYIIIVGQSLNICAFVYVMIRLEQKPPHKIRKRLLLNVNDDDLDGHVNETDIVSNENDNDPLLSSSNNDTSAKKRCCLVKIFHQCFFLLNSVWLTYTKPRSGRKRAYLLSFTLVYGFFVLGEMGRGSISTLFLFHTPFSWTGEQLGYYKSVGSIVTFFGNFVGAMVLKKFLKCRETTVLLVALVSSIGHFLVFGVSSMNWMLYLALSVGCLGPLFVPAAKSFTSQLVDDDEVGKSFVAYAITADLAIIIDVIAANSIYANTVDFYPGLIFLLCAGILGLCFIVVLCIHVDLIRWERKAKNQQIPTIPPNLT